MREIKFRAFSYGMRYLNTPEDFKYLFGGTDGPGCTLTECNLMQYTGLKDKNGKEIYEGDIIIYELLSQEFRDRIGKVVWNDFRSTFSIEMNPCANDDLFKYVRGNVVEVIGNICENPELLKEQD